jgi:hypothetical protein
MKLKMSLGLVAHNYKPSYLRSRDQEEHGSRPAWTKYSTNKLGMVAYVCNPNYVGSKGRRIMI